MSNPYIGPPEVKGDVYATDGHHINSILLLCLQCIHLEFNNTNITPRVHELLIRNPTLEFLCPIGYLKSLSNLAKYC